MPNIRDETSAYRELVRASDPAPEFELDSVPEDVQSVLLERASEKGFREAVLYMEDLLDPEVMQVITLPIARQEEVDSGSLRNEIVVALEPLREALMNTATAIGDVRDAEDQFWLAELLERRWDFTVKANDSIQRDFLRRVKHAPHDGYKEDEIPVGIAFRMTSVEMAKVLDMARDRWGNVSPEMLHTVLDEGTPYTDLTTFERKLFGDTAELRKEMQSYCGGATNRTQITNNLEDTSQILLNATKELFVSSTSSGQAVDTLAALRRVIEQNGENRLILQNADGLPEEGNEAILRVIDRVINAFVAGRERSNPKIDRGDMDYVMKYLRSTRKVHRSLTQLGEAMNEEVQRFARVVELDRGEYLEKLVLDITGMARRDYYDVIWVTEPELMQDKWTWVVSAYDRLANVRPAVTRKVLQLVKKVDEDSES